MFARGNYVAYRTSVPEKLAQISEVGLVNDCSIRTFTLLLH